MVIVDVYTIEHGEDVVSGHIGWDGKNWHVVPDQPWLRELLEQPILAPDLRGHLTHADGEKFLRQLHREYRGSALRVSKARHGDMPEPDPLGDALLEGLRNEDDDALDARFMERAARIKPEDMMIPPRGGMTEDEHGLRLSRKHPQTEFDFGSE